MRFILLPIVLLIAASSWGANPLRVLIDPGHGGTDTGATYGAAQESEIALRVATELKRLLDLAPGFSPSLTRSTDQNVSLEERVQISQEKKADLFVSIHTNASNDSRARGAEFYFENHLPADEESLYLASLENQKSDQVQSKKENSNNTDLSKKSDVLAIVDDLKHNQKMKRSHLLSKYLLQSWLSERKRTHANMIRQAPFYVISKTSVPSVLVELGFLSNPSESRKLMSAQYQKDVAKRIFDGLKDYKEMVDKAEVSRLQ